jgi:hypothetical protein
VGDWREQIRSIAHDLTNIEINTIEAEGMIGRKMPSYPHALIDIAQKYGDYLGASPICLDLDAFTRTFADGQQPLTRTIDRVTAPEGVKFDSPKSLEDSFSYMRTVVPVFRHEPQQYDIKMTNGWETFELLRWAARNVLRARAEALVSKRDIAAQAGFADLPPTVQIVLRRINRTSDQLRTVVRQLSDLAEQNAYIGKTRWELLAMGEPAKAAPPEYLSRIRKAWDIGVDQIVLQTVVQLDGDVIFRASPGLLASGGPTVEAHKSVTDVGLQHWQSLFDIVISLLGRAVDTLFGAPSADPGASPPPPPNKPEGGS